MITRFTFRPLISVPVEIVAVALVIVVSDLVTVLLLKDTTKKGNPYERMHLTGAWPTVSEPSSTSITAGSMAAHMALEQELRALS